MARIEEGLLPPVVIAGREAATWSLRERMEHYSVPGVSVAVIDDYRVAWARGYGVADVETGEPVTTETLFQAASITLTVEDGHLVAVVPGDVPHPLYPSSETDFFDATDGTRIEVTLGEDGRATEFQVRGGPRGVRIQR